MKSSLLTSSWMSCTPRAMNRSPGRNPLALDRSTAKIFWSFGSEVAFCARAQAVGLASFAAACATAVELREPDNTGGTSASGSTKKALLTVKGL